MAACASVRPAQRVAVDYNRAFAASRDEVLLLNILRAAGREPLQFSTMGSVTGSGTRGQASITLPFANVIAGTGADPFSLSPSLAINDSNPTLSIIPLSDQDFTRGILRPMSPEVLSYFLQQGRDAEFLLPLVVGGVRCPGGAVVLNRGDFTEDMFHRFAEMFAAAAGTGFTIEERRLDHGDPTDLRMAAKDALPLLQNGPGPGRRIVSMRADGDNATIRVRDSTTYWVVQSVDGTPPIDFTRVCDRTGGVTARLDAGRGFTLLQERSAGDVLRPDERTNGALLLRSVESVIYYLGETQRIWIDHELQRCAGREVGDGVRPPYPTYRVNRSSGEGHEARVLFRVRLGCTDDGVPLHTAVRTTFNGRSFFIPALNGRHDSDRTLKTLAFLSELIALQTSQSLIQSSIPTIAIQR